MTLSLREKIRLILDRYKITGDLWEYMTTRWGLYLPPKKQTSRKFMKDLLYDRKKMLYQKDIRPFKPPNW